MISATLMLFMTGAEAAELHLNFRQFPAKVFEGRPAPLRWDNNLYPKEWLFRYDANGGDVSDRLASDVYRRKAGEAYLRFGGHYVMLETGCGVAIQCGVMVDLRTGRMAAVLPTATTGWEYRQNSRLLVVNPTDADILANRDSFGDEFTYYYVWNGRDFDLLGQEPWPVDKAATEAAPPPVPDLSVLLPERVRTLPKSSAVETSKPAALTQQWKSVAYSERGNVRVADKRASAQEALNDAMRYCAREFDDCHAGVVAPQQWDIVVSKCSGAGVNYVSAGSSWDGKETAVDWRGFQLSQAEWTSCTEVYRTVPNR
jgi:hypothetical protein